MGYPTGHYNIKNKVSAKWDTVTTENSPSPVVSKAIFDYLAKEAINKCITKLRTHTDYDTFSVSLTDDSVNGMGGSHNNFSANTKTRIQNGHAIFFGDQLTHPMWVIRGDCLKFATSTAGNSAATVASRCKALLELYIAAELAEYQATQLESRGGTRSGSSEETDINDVASAITTQFGDI